MENGGFYLSITLFRIIFLYMYANHRILKIRFKKKIHSRSGFIALPFKSADKFPQCNRIKTQLCALSIHVLLLFLSLSSKQHSFNDKNNIKICKRDQSFGVQIENVKQKKKQFPFTAYTYVALYLEIGDVLFKIYSTCSTGNIFLFECLTLYAS